MLRCAICGEKFDPQICATLPFCSERCRQIDLGRWLTEDYSLPVEREEEPSDESESC